MIIVIIIAIICFAIMKIMQNNKDEEIIFEEPEETAETLGIEKKAEKVKRVLGIEIQVNLKYSQFDNLKYYCQKRKINISNTNYLENISCILTMEEETKEKFMEDYNKKDILLEQIKILDKKIIDKSI